MFVSFKYNKDGNALNASHQDIVGILLCTREKYHWLRRCVNLILIPFALSTSYNNQLNISTATAIIVTIDSSVEGRK